LHFFQDVTQVKFTGLEHIFNVSAVFCEFSLPFLKQTVTIRWYGVIIAFGLALAVLFGGRTAYKWKIDIYKMIDVLIYGALGGVIGARLYYVAFQWDQYKNDPLEIFQIWHGGLAIYGGLIAGLICALIVCKVEKINVPNLLDLCGMSFLIGQGIGRWGNFANQEAFGTNTSLPWGMYSVKTQAYLQDLVSAGTDLNVDPAKPVHPTFLYESLSCLLGFALLYLYCQKLRKFSGQIFLLYGIWYGVERAVVEGLRTDSLYITGTNIRTSQLLSVILVVVCAILYTVFTIRFTLHPKPIDGVDYYREIPLYRYKRKAAEAKKEETALLAKAEKAEADGKTAVAEKLRKQAQAKAKLFEENTEKARLDDEARAAKKAAKAK
jgi:phosphatidylglycerol:prolipoprotein diacylglycerol transferase